MADWQRVTNRGRRQTAWKPYQYISYPGREWNLGPPEYSKIEPGTSWIYSGKHSPRRRMTKSWHGRRNNKALCCHECSVSTLFPLVQVGKEKQPTSCSRGLLEKRMVMVGQTLRNLIVHLLCSLQSTTGPHPSPDKSTPHSHPMPSGP
jgi:hypothetical protein